MEAFGEFVIVRVPDESVNEGVVVEVGPGSCPMKRLRPRPNS